MKKLLSDPILKFLLVGFVFYIAYLALYEFWIHPKTNLDLYVINNTLEVSTLVLTKLGYIVSREGDKGIQIQGTPGLFMGDSCDGISLFALYSIFIIAFPGRFVPKVIFILIGILFIHILNILRVIALNVLETYSYEWTEFNHTYTFTILMYIFIFSMWLFWINKFSGFKRKTTIS